jgi:hypothetical protein
MLCIPFDLDQFHRERQHRVVRISVKRTGRTKFDPPDKDGKELEEKTASLPEDSERGLHASP